MNCRPQKEFTTSTPAEALPAAVLSRRQMVQRLGGGLGVLGLAGALSRETDAAPHSPHFKPRAKRIIQLFMNGGPYQGDLFDPKPKIEQYAGQRPAEVDLRTERRTAGLLPSPFKFSPSGECGLPVSELIPLTAKCIDDICVLRSVYADIPNHEPALLLMNNGTMLETRPSMGSWLSYGLGTANENLPAYVVLCPGRPIRFSVLWTSSFLPGEHQGTYIDHRNLTPEKLIPYLSNPNSTREVQRKQLDLMASLNALHRDQRPSDGRLDARMRAMETAFRMQTSATEAFDLGLETQSTRELYGEGHFANACLMARRLAERGVLFTQIYYGDGQPWDTHLKHDETVRKLCHDIDRPVAALLSDLKQCGLLDDTLVVWGGEFGRTPTSESGDGRDHNHYGFTMWMAGGGVRGGTTYGETDDFGFRAVQDRVHVNDLHATILAIMGFDHEKLTYRYAGRDFRLTDVAGKVIDRILV